MGLSSTGFFQDCRIPSKVIIAIIIVASSLWRKLACFKRSVSKLQREEKRWEKRREDGGANEGRELLSPQRLEWFSKLVSNIKLHLVSLEFLSTIAITDDGMETLFIDGK